MSAPMSPERLTEIRDRADYVRRFGVDSDEYELELLAGTDAPALLAENARLRAELAARPSRVAVQATVRGAAHWVVESHRDAPDLTTRITDAVMAALDELNGTAERGES